MTQAGFVAVIGAPNAGKSTLVNRLVGTKVSIVTQKVQTTRFPVRGVAIEGDCQMVLVDTPGIFQPRRRLDRAMVQAAWGGAREADAVVHLVDAQAQIAVADGKGRAADRKAALDVATIGQGLRAAARKAILALNKIDLLRRDSLLALTSALFDPDIHAEVFMISAEKGAGTSDLKQRLAFSHEGALGIVLRKQVAGHLGLYSRVDQSVQRPDPFAFDRNIFLLHRRNLHVLRRWGARRGHSGGTSRHASNYRTQQRKSHQCSRPVLKPISHAFLLFLAARRVFVNAAARICKPSHWLTR